ncbi:MAG: AAA family ATPase [Deltaproteobacteria bacterium]|jgi:hypothetical protein|nr:AAA family ATPase [Deltaproteobacteria bacterium]
MVPKIILACDPSRQSCLYTENHSSVVTPECDSSSETIFTDSYKTTNAFHGLIREAGTATSLPWFPFDGIDYANIKAKKQTTVGTSKAYLEKNGANTELTEAQAKKTLILMLTSQLFFIGCIMKRELKELWHSLIRTKPIHEENPQFKTVEHLKAAREGWRKIDSANVRRIIIDANIGEGKDAIAKAMLEAKERGDSSVPRDIVDAPIIEIDATIFSSTVEPRGVVAKKISSLVKLARKGPVIVYISEIDRIFAGDGTPGKASESVSKLLLSIMERPYFKRNLIVIGTTSRGGVFTPRIENRLDGKSTIVDVYPDLERYYQWLKPQRDVPEYGATKRVPMRKQLDLRLVETMLIEKDPTFLTLRPQRRMVIVKQTAKVITGSPNLEVRFAAGGEKAFEALDEARKRSAEKVGGPKVAVMFAAGPKRAVEVKGTATPKGEAAKRGEREGKGEGKRGSKPI